MLHWREDLVRSSLGPCAAVGDFAHVRSNDVSDFFFEYLDTFERQGVSYHHVTDTTLFLFFWAPACARTKREYQKGRQGRHRGSCIAGGIL